ncbi:MAG: hypothetical protein H8Z69_03495 [Nanohaloarchaea archaeon]|nr:hypothetical protein [Candidatus Nanohaloarchaea archaeon]
MKKKTLIITSAFLILLGGVSALTFDVSVDTKTEVSTHNTNVNSSFPPSASTTVTNTGSLGCSYRMKGYYSFSNRTEESFSNEKALWPGTTTDLELRMMPTNYTGEINGNLSIMYCGKEKNIDNFSVQIDERVLPENETKVVAEQVTNTSAKLEMDREEGIMVPVDSPAKWKPGPSRIVNGTAEIEYEAPIFREGTNLTYAVYSDGETDYYQVSLWKKETVLDRFTKSQLGIGLAVSVLLNLILILLVLRSRK